MWNNFSEFATMKRKLESSNEECDPIAASGVPPEDIPTERSFYSENSLFIYNWKEYSEPFGIPKTLCCILEQHKMPAIRNRSYSGTLPSGRTPFFKLLDGLNPQGNWERDYSDFLVERDAAGIIADKGEQKDDGDEFPNRNVIGMTLRTGMEDIEKISYPAASVNEMQRSIITNALSWLFSDDWKKRFRVIALNGPAGSGKTYILSQLTKFKSISVTYTTIARHMCSDVKTKYKNLETVTMCKFLMTTFGIDFDAAKILQEMVKHVPGHIFNECNNLHTSIREMQGTDKRNERWRLLLRKHFPKLRRYMRLKYRIFFLGRLSLMTAGLIGLYKNILRAHTEHTNTKIILIISGDINQIPPLFVTADTSYNFINDMADRVYNFEQHMHVKDPAYNEILLNLLKTDNLPAFLYKNFNHLDDENIEYRYPIERLLKAPKKIEDLIEWFNRENIENCLDLIFFSFTNKELHFNNHSMAVSIYKQLERFPDLKPSDYVQFQIQQSRNIRESKEFQFEFPIIADNGPTNVPVLPLIRFFPYKVVTPLIEDLPRLTIVYLLYWDKFHAAVFAKTSNRLFLLERTEFQINLSPDTIYYGFPLQLHVGETSFSSQDLTLTRNICVNASNATKKELYAMLSKAKSGEFCKRVHIP